MHARGLKVKSAWLTHWLSSVEMWAAGYSLRSCLFSARLLANCAALCVKVSQADVRAGRSEDSASRWQLTPSSSARVVSNPSAAAMNAL